VTLVSPSQEKIEIGEEVPKFTLNVATLQHLSPFVRFDLQLEKIDAWNRPKVHSESAFNHATVRHVQQGHAYYCSTVLYLSDVARKAQ